MSEKKPRMCANGCDKPVQPPSKVICKDCQDRTTEKLEGFVRRMEKQAPNA
jgi:hypothetical protein